MTDSKTFQIQARTKILVAATVVAALASVVTVARQSSHEATLAKQAAFEQSTVIQMAARERQGPKVASANMPMLTRTTK